MEEMLDLVDENDNVIGSTTRKDSREKVLLHRSVFVLVTNSRGEVLVHKRTSTKDMFPGYYDMFIGGTVESGETYEECAEREVKEEMGVKDPTPRFLFYYKHRSPTLKTNNKVFSITHDGPLFFQKEEIESGSFVVWETLKGMIKKKRFCPDSLGAFREYERRFRS